jgi:acyl-CoA hydrolase
MEPLKTPLFPSHEKTLVIRPEYLNHVGTVFGGFLMQWADDMAYNAASLAFPGAAFVTRRFESFDFTSPMRNGDILKVFSQVTHKGLTSCTVKVWGGDARQGREVFRTSAVMVNVDAAGKKQPLVESAARNAAV